MKEFDLVVIGGGPGGYTAAIRAAQLDMKVALVEQAELGGTCLNWGCIPTKSLLHSADLLREIRHASSLGIHVGKVSFDLEKMVGASRSAAASLSRGVAYLMKKNKIEVMAGSAGISEPGLVTVGNTELFSDNLIIATGASAKQPGNLKPDGKRIWNAAQAMTPASLPNKLLVIGAGAIGVEFASFYSALGSDVTLIEVLEQILPAEDQEIAAFARKCFERDGITVITGAVLGDVTLGKRLSVVINGETHSFDAAIVSVGVTGNTSALGLAEIGVQVDRGFIQVDQNQRTAVSGVYAIGDVAGVPCLAHKASHEGLIAVEAIAGLQPEALHRLRIPACTYSHPQIASIGLSEQKIGNRKVRIGRYPFSANGKAVATGTTEGMVKTIFDSDSGALLGAHLVGAGVSEMIQGFTIAMQLETTEQDLMRTIFPHPTLSESMHEAVLAAYERTINL